MKILSRAGKIIKYWFWKKPVAPPEPVKATEVSKFYTVITYGGQRINLRNHEVPLFNAMSRKDKRAMAQRFETMEKKGIIRFEVINGNLIAIYNRDYEAKANLRKQSIDKARRGE